MNELPNTALDPRLLVVGSHVPMTRLMRSEITSLVFARAGVAVKYEYE